MLIPSYAELMDVLNKESDEKDEVTSRYTIVIAAAKRARQIIEGDEPMVEEIKGKPLSTAVEEIYKNKIKIVPEGEGTVLVFKKPAEDLAEKNEFDSNNKKDLKLNLENDENNLLDFNDDDDFDDDFDNNFDDDFDDEFNDDFDDNFDDDFNNSFDDKLNSNLNNDFNDVFADELKDEI